MNQKFKAEGFLVIVLGCGYLGLTFYSLWRWNEAISGALVTGFALFAKETVTRFFDSSDTAKIQNTITPDSAKSADSK